MRRISMLDGTDEQIVEAKEAWKNVFNLVLS